MSTKGTGPNDLRNGTVLVAIQVYWEVCKHLLYEFQQLREGPGEISSWPGVAKQVSRVTPKL